MNETDRLVEQHIREYQSRLTHLDELLERAHAKATTTHREQLEELGAERDRLASHVDRLAEAESPGTRDKLLEKAGPMGIWDAVAQQLERLVERLER